MNFKMWVKILKKIEIIIFALCEIPFYAVSD